LLKLVIIRMTSTLEDISSIVKTAAVVIIVGLVVYSVSTIINVLNGIK